MPRIDRTAIPCHARAGSLALGTLLLFLVLPLSALAQTTSTIEGTVTDATGAVVVGAAVRVSGVTLVSERGATSDARGFYRITALPPGTYTVTISAVGFALRTIPLELPLNRVVVLDATMQLEGVEEAIDVSTPMIEARTTATGATITPQQITELPVSGRNYLDLLQLVPGVAINRQVDPNSDRSNPILGERSGNNNFLIDGVSNKDTVNGGPGQQFNQETIAEFQVLTGGYKAEFGQASGGGRQRHHQERQQSVPGHRLAVLPRRRARLVELARRDADRAAAAPPLQFQPGGRRPDRQGPRLLLRVGRAHQRAPPARFHLSGHRQRAGQPAAPRPGGPVRRADPALRDAGVRQVRSAGRPASADPAGELHRYGPQELPAAVGGGEPAVGPQRYRHRPAAARVWRLGAARQSGQPLDPDAARRVPRRERRHGPLAVHADRRNGLQSL
jgi:hypothetical protein